MRSCFIDNIPEALKKSVQILTILLTIFQPVMAAWLNLASVIAVLFSLANAHKNYTVTEEIWFDVEVKDHDGLGEDYRGRFVVAVFGDKCPMTSMNFQSLAKGYKRGTVSFILSHIGILKLRRFRIQNSSWKNIYIAFLV